MTWSLKRKHLLAGLDGCAVQGISSGRINAMYPRITVIFHALAITCLLTTPGGVFAQRYGYRVVIEGPGKRYSAAVADVVVTGVQADVTTPWIVALHSYRLNKAGREPILGGSIGYDLQLAPDTRWETLMTLSFSQARGIDFPTRTAAGQTKIKGDLCVKIQGAGQVQIEELHLVQNKYKTDAWVIASEDVRRILMIRKSQPDQPRK